MLFNEFGWPPSFPLRRGTYTRGMSTEDHDDGNGTIFSLYATIIDIFMHISALFVLAVTAGPPAKRSKTAAGVGQKRKDSADSDEEGDKKFPGYQATFAWDHYPFPVPAVCFCRRYKVPHSSLMIFLFYV
jgi:hypothetical protein